MSFDARSGQAQYERQQRRITARRARNEELRKRFLDAKQRTLGVDIAGLDAQVKEKKERIEAEKLADKMYAEQQRQIRDLIELNIIKENADSQATALQVAAAQRAQRDPTLRREWHLNNPNALKSELPPRTGDHDSRLGPSSIQVFDGEDLKKGDRVRMQQLQMRDWTAQILAEKRAKQEAEKEANQAEATMINQIVSLGNEIEAKEADDRLVESMVNARTNLQLAEDKRHRDATLRQSEQDRAASEVTNLTNSAWLNEHRAEGLNRMGKPRRDQWKGMSTDEIAQIYASQQRQIEAKHERKLEELARDREYSEYQRSVLNATQEMSRRELEEEEFRTKQIRMDQARQIVEKRVRDEIARKDRIGSITDDFFKGFGSSHR